MMKQYFEEGEKKMIERKIYSNWAFSDNEKEFYEETMDELF